MDVGLCPVSKLSRRWDPPESLCCNCIGRPLKDRWEGVFLSESEHLERIESPYGLFFAPSDDVITEQLKIYGAHTRPELAMVLSTLREGDLVVDVGAHLGTFGIPMGKKVGPTGDVYCFEPLPERQTLLKRNIAENGLADTVHPIRALISDVIGAYELSEGSTGGVTRFEPKQSAASNDAECVILDQWWTEQLDRKRVSLFKVDTDGMDLNVLRSAREMISTHLPTLYVEIHRGLYKESGESITELERFLGGLGYHYFRNIGPRNAPHDGYRMARLRDLKAGGYFYDVLAVHPSSDRYPDHLEKRRTVARWLARERALELRRFAAVAPAALWRKIKQRVA